MFQQPAFFSALVCGLLLLSSTSAAETLPNEPHVAVSGHHEVRVVPDMVSLSLSLAEVGSDVAGARDSVEQRSAQLIRTLQEMGVDNADINSASLQITPHYNWNNRAQVYVGTEVARQIEITLRDIDQYDALIRAIIDADVARINRTELLSSKETELRAEALQGAIADARARAELLVGELPQTVGNVFSISAMSGHSVMKQARFQAADRVLMESFQPGEMGFSENVQVVFYLKN